MESFAPINVDLDQLPNPRPQRHDTLVSILPHAFIDTMTEYICVVDDAGRVLMTNLAWREHASRTRHPLWVLEQQNFLNACQAVQGPDEEGVRAIGARVRAVIADPAHGADYEFRCHAGPDARTFAVRISALQHLRKRRVIINMLDVTARAEAQREADARNVRQQQLVEFSRKALVERSFDSLTATAIGLLETTLGLEDCRVTLHVPVGKPAREDAAHGRVAVVIPGRSRPIGMLSGRAGRAGGLGQMGRSEPSGRSGRSGRSGPSADETDFLQGVANILGGALARQRSEARLLRLTRFDEITGLPNRDLFRDRLSQLLAQAGRSATSIAVLAVDLDHFRNVNEAHGHANGDRLLAQAAARIQRQVRPGETISRIASDEFAVIVSHLSCAEEAGEIASDILQALREPFELDGEEVCVTASIGIAIYPGDAHDADELWKGADLAKERAKGLRRGTYQFHTAQMTSRAAERLTLVRELRSALVRAEFEIHYQPKYDVMIHQVNGLEALLRWRHPSRGLVSPADFIPVLEETGLIVPIGEWVVRAVCEQLEAWRTEGLRVCPVAINLSAVQFERPDLDTRLREIIAAHGVEAELIELEITESMLMNDPQQAADALRRLRAAGFRIAIDDFGTGYSSLSRLMQFPLDALKIDRSFIRDIAADPDQAVIARTIIQLAHNLKLTVIAEGVETEMQYNFLVRQGCEQMQGHLFSPPVPAAEYAKLIGLSAPGLSTGAPSAQPRLLILDDDERDLELMRHALRNEGYTIASARDPQTAFELLAAEPAAVVITDQNMPEITGVKFLTAVRQLYPETIRIVVTGGADTEDITAAINDAAIHKFVPKDWAPERIRLTVAEAFQLYAGGTH